VPRLLGDVALRHRLRDAWPIGRGMPPAYIVDDLFRTGNR
jgi:hypothetical protein